MKSLGTDATPSQPVPKQILLYSASHTSPPRDLTQEKQLHAHITATAQRDPTAAVELILSRIQWASPWRDGQPHILCFERLRFELDIVQLRLRGTLNYSTLDNGLYNALLRSITQPVLDKNERRQSFYPADQSPNVLAHKRQAVALARLLIERIQRTRPVQALLFANMDYFQNWPLEEICPELGIKTLCLSREHYVSDFLRKRKQAILRESGFRYRGDGIALFGECSLPVFTETNVCPPEKLHVTGAPRFDAWRDLRPDIARRNNITLLSFSGGKYQASACYPQVLETFARLSHSFWTARGCNYIIKCKTTAERETVRQMLKNYPKHKCQLRLGNLLEILFRSRLVIGINSLALLEALLSDAQIVVPYWSDARQTPEQSMLDPTDLLTRRCVTFAESPRELRRLITRAARSKPRPLSAEQRAERLTLLRRYFHYPEDTTCTACVEKFLLSAIGANNG